MVFVSATRLRLRSFLVLPAFMSANGKVTDQVRRAEGFLGGKVLIERRLTFWTCTTWRDQAAMTAFRDSGVHREVMPKLLDWCDEAAVAQWEGVAPQTWDAVYARILDGRSSRLRKPSPNHQARQFPPPRNWIPEGVITPAKSATDPN